ncbi:amino acid ABC transporter permease [Anaerolineae bacterium CFX7]|nr:amino acid ABC transporter permease [Anaerolineae bacterium CFX7]
MASTRPETPGTFQVKVVDRLSGLPWWLILLLLGGAILAFQFASNETYQQIFRRILSGILVTLSITALGYSCALVLGLLAGLGRVSKNVVLFNLSTLYVQVVRGIPMLVQIFYWGFVIFPGLIGLLNVFGDMLAPALGADNVLAKIKPSDINLYWVVVIALAFAYGGYEAETFRAGIESIGKGQVEAARSLGMTYFQAMRFVVLPQAIRRVLPPLGNDLISMLKDSSLASVLGVRDITQEARLYASTTFRYVEAYNSLAFIYLTLTLTLSLLTRWIETRWKQL